MLLLLIFCTVFFFFFNDTPTTDIYTLSLHDALPIHAPTRLSIVSLLAATDWAEFKFVRDSLGLSDSALSKQLTTLEEAGYVEIRKGFVGKRARTTVRLRPAGRHAF